MEPVNRSLDFRFVSSPLAKTRLIEFVRTAPGAKTVLKQCDQVLQGCLQTFQQRQEVRPF
jgi:hypothetical protein